MILPTKHLPPDRAIISVASEVYNLIGKRSSVSSIWNDLQDKHNSLMQQGKISYDWFILSLDFLYIIGAIEENSGRIMKVGE